MIDRSKLWTTTGALYAVAAALIVLAVATGNSIFSHRYEFVYLGGGYVVRGDTVSGNICEFGLGEAMHHYDLCP